MARPLEAFFRFPFTPLACGGGPGAAMLVPATWEGSMNPQGGRGTGWWRLPFWVFLAFVLGSALAQSAEGYLWAAHALRLRGEELLLSGRYGEAAETFARALAYYPRYGEVHLGRAQALLALGRSDEASFHLAAFLILVREHPAREWARFLLAGLGYPSLGR